MQQTAFISGRYLSRDWHGYDVREYDLNPSIWQSGTTALEQWSAFWHHINGGADEGYLIEPISETHRELICGGLGDGTKTTFPIPALTPTSVTVFVNGVPQESSAYTVHSVANVLTDSQATCSDIGLTTPINGAEANATGVSCDGLSAIKVTPDGAGASSLRIDTARSGISEGDIYSVVVSVLPTASTSDNYRAALMWLTSGSVFISASSETYTASAPGTWSTRFVSAAAPATAEKVYPRIQREDTGTEPFYVDCFALCPGDYDRWHLPSQAPGLIEFATAPASGARITATATGQRIARCRFEPGSRWSMRSPGHASSRSIRAIEVVEF